MSPCRVIVLAFVAVVASQAGDAASDDLKVWEGSVDPVKKERFIPVELWTGGEWDGKKELKMARVTTRFGTRWNKEITGPTEWKHPVTGETLLVYERTNQEREGVKRQLFAMNEGKTGLGRVYDSRREFGTRTFSGGLKFPVGLLAGRGDEENRREAVRRNQGRNQSGVGHHHADRLYLSGRSPLSGVLLGLQRS